MKRIPAREMIICGAGLLAVAIANTGAPAAARQAKPRPQAVGTVRQIMHVLDPSADAIWGSVATIVSPAGIEERAPRTDDQWQALAAHAVAVAEVGNLLMLPGRAVDEGRWLERAEQLRSAGRDALRAAEDRNAAAMLAAGEHITDACDRCHQQYWPSWHDTDLTALAK